MDSNMLPLISVLLVKLEHILMLKHSIARNVMEDITKRLGNVMKDCTI